MKRTREPSVRVSKAATLCGQRLPTVVGTVARLGSPSVQKHME